MSEALYDRIGAGYSAWRRPDPRLAARIADALGPPRTVVNVGAGAGSYEPTERAVVTVEPAAERVRQQERPRHTLTDKARTAHAPPADEQLGAALVTLGGVETAVRRISIPSRRTVRKTTVWTPDEWRHIEEEARARSAPPLRYVREAALAAKVLPHTRRRRVHTLVREFKWVLK